MNDPRQIFGRLGNQMFQYAFLYAYSKDNATDVYFQDPKWFEKHESEIKKLFSDGIGFVPEVGIHLRRGDYVANPFYVDLSQTDYYERAIAKFPNQQCFLVFSDNIEFAKEYFTDNRFLGKTFYFSEGNDELTDFNLLASCSSQIIANSSFSWWAGYLNPNPAKMVVYPSKWFSDGISRVGFPKEWISV